MAKSQVKIKLDKLNELMSKRGTTKLDRITAIGELLQVVMADYTVDKLNDPIRKMDLLGHSKLMKVTKDQIDLFGALKTRLQKIYDFIRMGIIPDEMEEKEITSIIFEGIGRVTITADMNVSIPAELKDAAFTWLDDHGHGDLITQTVNSSSLKALAKNLNKKGEELPGRIFKVSPFSRATITAK